MPWFPRSEGETRYASEYGTWLSSRRRAADLTQQDLAVLIEVSQATVDRWERGKTLPNLYHGQRIRGLLRKLGALAT